MEELKTLLINHWESIFKVFLAVLAFILLIIKKKPIKFVDDAKSYIVQLLPYVIKGAENTFGAGNGENKKTWVIENVIKSLVVQFGLSKETAMSYKSFISKSIEAMLSTPQKKDS